MSKAMLVIDDVVLDNERQQDITERLDEVDDQGKKKKKKVGEKTVCDVYLRGVTMTCDINPENLQTLKYGAPGNVKIECQVTNRGVSWGDSAFVGVDIRDFKVSSFTPSGK